MKIRLLGGFEVRTGVGPSVRFATRKTELLFAALVLAGRRGLRRETLAEAFWPGRSGTQAGNSLRQALADIRRRLKECRETDIHIANELEMIVLTGEADAADVWAFEMKSSADSILSLAAAADLYRSDLLYEFTLPDGLDEWFGPLRQNYRQRALELVERISLFPPTPGSAEENACERLAVRLLLPDATAEPAHRALMRLLAARGQQNAAMRQFEVCCNDLRKHLDVEPETQTAELAAALKLISGGATREKYQLVRIVQSTEVMPPPRMRDQPSVAVMPFDNLGPSEDDYFADGVVEEVTSALSRIRDFFVIARQSAFTYKGKLVDAQTVGRELGVNYIVEGTVRRGGDRLRISVQLVDTETRTQLWSSRHEGHIDDVFEFQDRIAEQVAGQIHPAIRGAEIDLARRRPPNSLGAYDLVMRAYPHLWGRRRETSNEAIDLLNRAVAADPAYGRAHALLAWCHASRAVYLWSEHTENELELVRKAVDSTGPIADDPTALTAAGSAMSMIGDQDRATSYIKQALALDPNNAWAWARYGWIGIYSDDTRNAHARFERAMTLSPMDPIAFNMKLGVATSLAKSGLLDDAIAIAREVIAANPEIILSYRFLAAWSAMNNDLDTARSAARRLLAAQPGFTIKRYCSLPLFRLTPDWANRVACALRLAGLPDE